MFFIVFYIFPKICLCFYNNVTGNKRTSLIINVKLKRLITPHIFRFIKYQEASKGIGGILSFFVTYTPTAPMSENLKSKS